MTKEDLLSHFSDLLLVAVLVRVFSREIEEVFKELSELLTKGLKGKLHLVTVLIGIGFVVFLALRKTR